MSEASRSDGGAVEGSGACWTSRSETVKCCVEADDKTGELRNRCERVKQTVRHCTGQPDQGARRSSLALSWTPPFAC